MKTIMANFRQPTDGCTMMRHLGKHRSLLFSGLPFLLMLFFLYSAVAAENEKDAPKKTMAEADDDPYGDDDKDDGGDESNLTPKYLMDQFHENGDAAWKKYKDRELSVTGYIREIGKDKSGRYVVIGTLHWQNKQNKNIITCYLKDSSEEQTSEFQPGEFVRVEGMLARKGDSLSIGGGTVNKAKEPNTFNREFVPPKFKKCEKCHGSGFVRVEKDNYNSKKLLSSSTKKIKCPACNGKGEIKVSPGHYRKIEDAPENKDKKD